MVKLRLRSPTRKQILRPKTRPKEQSSIIHTSLYLPVDVYEALRRVAFEERCKIHDVVMEGVALALKKRGYVATRPSTLR